MDAGRHRLPLAGSPHSRTGMANELANAVLRTLNMDMPDSDLSSLRGVPWAPRRHHPYKAWSTM